MDMLDEVRERAGRALSHRAEALVLTPGRAGYGALRFAFATITSCNIIIPHMSDHDVRGACPYRGDLVSLRQVPTETDREIPIVPLTREP